MTVNQAKDAAVCHTVHIARGIPMKKQLALTLPASPLPVWIGTQPVDCNNLLTSLVTIRNG